MMSEPLTAAQRQAIRMRHVSNHLGAGGRCRWDANPWPCEVAILLAELERREAERDAVIERAASHLRCYHGGACQYFDPALPLPADVDG